VAATTTSTISEYIDTALQVAKLGLHNRTIFAPGDAAQMALDIADLRNVQGSTATFGRLNTLTASDVGEGVEYQAWQALDPTTVDVAATKHQVGTHITKEAINSGANELQLWVKAGEELAASMGTKVNVDVCSAFASFSASQGSTGTDIVFADIRTAYDTLMTAKARPPFFCVLHTHQWTDLMSESSSPLVDASKNPLAEGFYGQYFYDDLLGMNWFLTQDVQTANAGADLAGAMFTSDAIGISWKQDFELEAEWNKNKQQWELLMTGFWGVGIADNSSGIKLVTDA